MGIKAQDASGQWVDASEAIEEYLDSLEKKKGCFGFCVFGIVTFICASAYAILIA